MLVVGVCLCLPARRAPPHPRHVLHLPPGHIRHSAVPSLAFLHKVVHKHMQQTSTPQSRSPPSMPSCTCHHQTRVETPNAPLISNSSNNLLRDSSLVVVLQRTHRPQHVTHVTLALVWPLVVPPAPLCLRRPRLPNSHLTRLTAFRRLCLHPTLQCLKTVQFGSVFLSTGSDPRASQPPGTIRVGIEKRTVIAFLSASAAQQSRAKVGKIIVDKLKFMPGYTSVAGAAAAAIASIPGGFMYMNCTPCLSLNLVCSSGPRKDSV
jgi:hypothetical protein